MGAAEAPDRRERRLVRRRRGGHAPGDPRQPALEPPARRAGLLHPDARADPCGGRRRALRRHSLRAERRRVQGRPERWHAGGGGAREAQDRARRHPVLRGQGRDVRGALQPRRRVPAPGDGGVRRADGARCAAPRRSRLRAEARRMRLTRVVAGVLAVLAIGGLAWWLAAGAEPVTVDAIGDQVQTLPRGQLPVFAAKEEVARLYRFAAENPDTLAWMPCTCGCESLGHTSNRACYIKAEEPGRVTFTSHAAT